MSQISGIAEVRNAINRYRTVFGSNSFTTYELHKAMKEGFTVAQVSTTMTHMHKKPFKYFIRRLPHKIPSKNPKSLGQYVYQWQFIDSFKHEGRVLFYEYDESLAEVYDTSETDIDLDYSQIGKAIVERINDLQKFVDSNMVNLNALEVLKQDNKKLTKKIEEQHNTILKLNRTIGDLNKQLRMDKPRVSNKSTFKLGEIARIK